MENNKKKLPLMIGSIVMLVVLALAVVSMIFFVLGEMSGNTEKPGDINWGQEDEWNPGQKPEDESSGEENKEHEENQDNNSFTSRISWIIILIFGIIVLIFFMLLIFLS